MHRVYNYTFTVTILPPPLPLVAKPLYTHKTFDDLTEGKEPCKTPSNSMIPFDYQNMQAMIKENVACFPLEAAGKFKKYYVKVKVGKQAKI